MTITCQSLELKINNHREAVKVRGANNKLKCFIV